MKEDINSLIEEVLREKPSYDLSKDYKDRILRQIKKKEQLSQLKLNFLFIGIAVISICTGLGMIFAFKINTLFNGLEQVVPMAVLIGLIAILIQYLDKKLVKDKLYKNLTS